LGDLGYFTVLLKDILENEGEFGSAPLRVAHTVSSALRGGMETILNLGYTMGISMDWFKGKFTGNHRFSH